MLIVDSQVHIWGADTIDRPWPKDRIVPPHRQNPMSKDELLVEMNRAGVDRVILVPPSWEGDRNDLVLCAAKAHPDRFAVMGRIDPEAPEARDQIATWTQQTGMLGLRFSLRSPPLKRALTEGRMEWIWPQAQKHGIPIYILVTHSDANLIDDIARRHPGLRLVMDHCGLVDGKDDEAFAKFDQLLSLAKYPNVAAKASCFPFFTNDQYPFKRVHRYLKQVFDAFGPRRMFWGTDLTRLPCTYEQGLTMFTEELPWLRGEDLEWVMGRGVCEWLRWKT